LKRRRVNIKILLTASGIKTQLNHPPAQMKHLFDPMRPENFVLIKNERVDIYINAKCLMRIPLDTASRYAKNSSVDDEGFKVVGKFAVLSDGRHFLSLPIDHASSILRYVTQQKELKDQCRSASVPALDRRNGKNEKKRMGKSNNVVYTKALKAGLIMC